MGIQDISEYGPLAQLGERQVRNLEVRGSIPLWSTKTKTPDGVFFLGGPMKFALRASEILLRRVKLLRSEIFAGANVGNFNFTFDGTLKISQ